MRLEKYDLNEDTAMLKYPEMYAEKNRLSLSLAKKILHQLKLDPNTKLHKKSVEFEKMVKSINSYVQEKKINNKDSYYIFLKSIYQFLKKIDQILSDFVPGHDFLRPPVSKIPQNQKLSDFVHQEFL